MTEIETAPTATASTEALTPEASHGPALEFDTYSNSLSDAHKELLTKNNINSFEAQEKWVSGLNSALGKKGLIAPGEGASDDDKAAYKETLYDELGRPEDGKYDFDLPEGSKDDAYSDDFMNGLAGVAHKYGMSAEGFQELINTIAVPYNEMIDSWANELGSIKRKLGEDTLDDDAVSKDGLSKDSIHEQARTKSIEASSLFRNGDFKAADTLQSEAKELYARLATMN